MQCDLNSGPEPSKNEGSRPSRQTLHTFNVEKRSNDARCADNGSWWVAHCPRSTMFTVIALDAPLKLQAGTLLCISHPMVSGHLDKRKERRLPGEPASDCPLQTRWLKNAKENGSLPLFGRRFRGLLFIIEILKWRLNRRT